jgi:cytochrome c551/c552
MLPCDVNTVLVDSCQKCHSAPPQFGAPMPLVTYADLQAPAHSDPTKKVYEVVETRIHDTAAPMPQPPNPALDAADMATIDSWVAAGAPSSSVACASRDAGADASVVLSCTPDTHLISASPWTMPTDTEDIYVCYGVNLGLTSKRQVTAIAPRVDNHSIVHHALLFESDTPVSSTPAPCSPGGSSDWRIVYGWAPGGQPFELPPQAGFAEDQTTNYVVQVHYNNINQLANEMDSSGFDLCTTDQLRPNDADVLAFGSVKFTIPPHDGLDITCSVTIPQEYSGIHVIAAFPHMHELGKLIETSLVPAPGGPSLDLGSQPTWNFQSQLWFPLTQDVELGDVVNTRCAWENTTDAPVGFGPYTEDEMCYSFTMYYPKITATTWYWGAPALTSKCSPTVSQ